MEPQQVKQAQKKAEFHTLGQLSSQPAGGKGKQFLGMDHMCSSQLVLQEESVEE